MADGLMQAAQLAIQAISTIIASELAGAKRLAEDALNKQRADFLIKQAQQKNYDTTHSAVDLTGAITSKVIVIAVVMLVLIVLVLTIKAVKK